MPCGHSMCFKATERLLWCLEHVLLAILHALYIYIYIYGNVPIIPMQGFIIYWAPGKEGFNAMVSHHWGAWRPPKPPCFPSNFSEHEALTTVRRPVLPTCKTSIALTATIFTLFKAIKKMAACDRHHKRGGAAIGRASSFVIFFVMAFNRVGIVAINAIVVLHVVKTGRRTVGRTPLRLHVINHPLLNPNKAIRWTKFGFKFGFKIWFESK